MKRGGLMHCTKISAEFECGGHSPPGCAPPQMWRWATMLGNISAGCLVCMLDFLHCITVESFTQICVDIPKVNTNPNHNPTLKTNPIPNPSRHSNTMHGLYFQPNIVIFKHTIEPSEYRAVTHTFIYFRFRHLGFSTRKRVAFSRLPLTTVLFQSLLW